MLLQQWFVGRDLPLDLSRVTRRWIELVVADAAVGPVQVWQDLHQSLMDRLAEVVEDPEGPDPQAGEALGAAWQVLRQRAPDRFDRAFFHLQVAWQDYLNQTQLARGRTEAFFTGVLRGLHGEWPALVRAASPEDWLRRLRPGELGLQGVAEAVIASVQQGYAWTQAAFYWWDVEAQHYRPLHSAHPLDEPAGFGDGRPPTVVLQGNETRVEVAWPWLRLWQPLLEGRGLLVVGRPARAPVQMRELQALATLAAQADLLLAQAETLRQTQDSRQTLSRQVVELATATAELKLLQEIVQLAQRFGDSDALGGALLERLSAVLVAERSEWWRLDAAGQSLWCRQAQGGCPPAGHRPVPDKGWLAHANGLVLQPLLADDEPARRGRPRRMTEGRRLIMPVCAGERFIGTIDFVRPQSMAPFTEADVRLAATLGGCVSPLIRQLELQDELAVQARQDRLTALPHRQHLRHLLESAWAQAGWEDRPFSLLLIDVDRLGSVNETLGFPVGDAVLRAVADRLVAGVARLGSVGRWGDDEFLVLLPGLGRTEAQRLARKLYSACAEPMTQADLALPMTISIGRVTAEPGEPADAERMLRAADRELIQAKAKRDQLRLAQYWEQDDDGHDPPQARADRR
jgi:diguanylate cyclase (GGDEF)-like protein